MSEPKKKPAGFPWGPWFPGGPWSADGGIAEPRRCVTVDITVDGSAWGDPNMTERYERYEAIARLAAAAPTLLSFARRMAERDCTYGDDCPDLDGNRRHGPCVGCLARAALAKGGVA